MKKLFTLVISIILCVCFLMPLTACDDNSVSTNKVVNPRTETIKVGYVDYAPLNYTYKGKFTGYNTKLAVSIFEALGYDVKFVLVEPTDEDRRTVNAEDVYSALEDGSIDCFFGGITDAILYDDTLFDFSYRYMENSPCLVIVNGDGYIQTAQDFEEKTVAFGIYSAGEKYFYNNLVSMPNLNFVNCEKGQSSALHKANSYLEDADCAIVDTLFAYHYLEKTNEYRNLILNSAQGYQIDQHNYLRVVFKKSETGTNELRDNVNKTLEFFASTTKTVDNEVYSLSQALAIGENYSVKNLVDFIITDFSIKN